MCKVACCSGITDNNREDVWLFMIALGDLMSRANTDGIGYAAFDSQGKIFGERWLINKTWFRDLSKDRRIKPHVLQSIYNFFGERVNRNDVKSILLHTRMATSGKGMKNTHPFVDDFDNPNFALIHNGIIYNDKKFKKVHSTCDSEVILHEYIKEAANEDPTLMSEFTKELEGWFTCMVLAKDKEQNPIIDVFTDNGRLASYWVPKLGVRVYSSEASDIIKAAEILGLQITKPLRMEADTFFRIDAFTGDVTHQGEIEVAKSAISVAEGNFDDDYFLANWLGDKFTSRGHSDV